jgi:hypothetical protein
LNENSNFKGVGRVFVTKSFTLAYLFIVLTIIASCGVKKNSSLIHEDTKSLLKAQRAALSCNQVNQTELIKKSKKLISDIESIANSYGRQFLVSTNRYFVESGNLFSPLVLGEGKIEEIYNDLNEKLTQNKVSNFQNFNWTDFIQKKDFFVNIVDRWTFHQCHLSGLVNNTNQEISDFLTIESQFCSENCITGDDFRLIEKDEKEIRRKVINMCSLVKRKTRCSVEYDLALIHKGQKEFIKDTLNKVRGFYLKELFSPSESSLNITCRKEQGKYILSLPVDKKPLSFERSMAIKKYWENERMSLEFKVLNGGLKINETNETVSYVSSKTPNMINLSSKLFGELKNKTIAHEFGHILGFRDCYIEYYNGNSQEVTYFELEREQGNLMCSLMSGKKIPNKYQDSLIEKYCD